MSKYSPSRTLSEVRLKSWPTGHIQQLKLAVQRLETQLNSSLTQSTKQTERRRISSQVPFILPQSISIKTGFRQVQFSWKAPPGLNGHPQRQLLFYEIQHATTTSFANSTTLRTPQTSITIAGLNKGGSRSFRIRVVSTEGLASVWSDTQTIRLARNRIEVNALAGITSTSGIDKRLTKNIGEWQTVMSTSYVPFGGAASINLHATLACPHHDLDLKVGGSTVETYYSGPAFVQFRFRLGTTNNVGDVIFSELGASRFILSARPGYLSTTDLEAITPTAFGTFMTAFFRPGASDSITIELQAAKMPGSEWAGRDGTRGTQISSPLVSIRNALVLETLEQ